MQVINKKTNVGKTNLFFIIEYFNMRHWTTISNKLRFITLFWRTRTYSITRSFVFPTFASWSWTTPTIFFKYMKTPSLNTIWCYDYVWILYSFNIRLCTFTYKSSYINQTNINDEKNKKHFEKKIKEKTKKYKW